MRLIELFEDLPALVGLTPSINTAGLSTIKPIATNTNGNTANTPAATTTIDPSITQELNTRNSTIQVPAGPNKVKTTFKISGIDQQTGNVVLTNPQAPNQPGISYSKDQLSQILTAEKGI